MYRLPRHQHRVRSWSYMNSKLTKEQYLLPRQSNESEYDYQLRQIDAAIFMSQQLIDTPEDKVDVTIFKNCIDKQLEKRLKLTQISPT